MSAFLRSVPFPATPKTVYVNLDRQATGPGDHTRVVQSSTTEDGPTPEMLSILSHPHSRHVLLTSLEQETPIEIGRLATGIAVSDPETLRTVTTGTTGAHKNDESEL